MSIIISALKDELNRYKRMLTVHKKEGNTDLVQRISREIEMVEEMIELANNKYSDII